MNKKNKISHNDLMALIGLLPLRVPMGEHKMTFLAGRKGKAKKFTAFTVFVKTEGSFTEKDNGTPVVAMADPIVAFDFKNKKSINTLIAMLEYFRDNEWGKTQEEIEAARGE